MTRIELDHRDVEALVAKADQWERFLRGEMTWQEFRDATAALAAEATDTAYPAVVVTRALKIWPPPGHE